MKCHQNGITLMYVTYVSIMQCLNFWGGLKSCKSNLLGHKETYNDGTYDLNTTTEYKCRIPNRNILLQSVIRWEVSKCVLLIINMLFRKTAVTTELLRGKLLYWFFYFNDSLKSPKLWSFSLKRFYVMVIPRKVIPL